MSVSEFRGVAQTSRPNPYPVHALGPLQGAVEAVEGLTQAPVEISAQSAIAAASLALQGHANVETLGGDAPLSLFCMTIARSGERKSKCDNILLSPLREHERTLVNAVQGDHLVWSNRHALWKCDRDQILNDRKSRSADKRAAAEAALAVLGPEPTQPPSPDRTVTEPTFEGLTLKFIEGHPSLGIFSDEGGQFLGGHAMNRENRQKTLAALNDLWQGNPIRRTRKGDGSVTLYDRRLAVHLMVQPGVAHDFLSDPMTADTGFIARFLLCEPQSTVGTRFQESIREDRNGHLPAFNERLMEILARPEPMDPETRALKPRLLPLSKEARDLLIAFNDRIEYEQRPGGELCNAVAAASKAAEQAARIAGVFTLWRDLDAEMINAREMADGITLALCYLEEAVRLRLAATISAETRRAETLRRWLVETWPHEEIVLREAQNGGPIRDSKDLLPALGRLEKFGWLVPLQPGTVIRGSARKKAWRIVGPDHVV